MSSRVSLSGEERENILREIRSADQGERVPVRSNKVSGKKGSGGFVSPPSNKSRKKGGRGFRRSLFAIITILIIFGGLFSAKMLKVGQSVLNKDRSIFAQLADLIIPGERQLNGEKNGQVNILLMAIGGQGHQGENLTDTVMVAMLRPKEKKVALLSIPRDLYVKLPGSNSYTKLNAVHAFKENGDPGKGPLYLQDKVEEITGLPIHYYTRVDFTAFKKVVDEIGGVEVTIPSPFYDYWHKISFPSGKELMDGERALSYVRARYVEGPEGGDFKRAARQQQVLLAIRDKIFSANTAFDLRAVSGILDALSDNVATNFNLWELRRLFDISRGMPKENIRTAVLSTGANGLLSGGTEILDGRPASVLRPRAGAENYSQIQEFTKNLFESTDEKVALPTFDDASPSPEAATSPVPTVEPVAEKTPADEKPTAEIRNGTNIAGLAAKTSAKLKAEKITVLSVGNGSKRDRDETIVIDLTGGKKPDSLKNILSLLGVKTTVSFPDSEAASKADFLILLGKDASTQ